MNTENQEKVIIVGTPSHQYNALCSCPDCQKQRNGGGHNWWDVPEQCNQLSAQIEILTHENKSMASVLIEINEYCQLNNIGKIGDSAGLALITHCKELAAQVEVLREAWEAVKATDWDKPLEEAFAATPQQHLRDVRAEAGRAGFIAGFSACWREVYGTKPYQSTLELYADQYAASVKAGE